MSNHPRVHLPEDRYFDPNPRQRETALHLYSLVAHAPLVCPHGHVDPRMFADPDYTFGTPTELLLVPDHYVFRMLYSQGIPLERLGIRDRSGAPTESDHRKIWQIFAENFHLFRGTPTGMWLVQELHDVFGIEDKLSGHSGQDIYDQVAERLTRPDFRPRRLFERFRIEVLATTDSATDPLQYHQMLRTSGWKGRIVPTFRPDAVVNIDRPDWRENIDALSRVSGVDIHDYRSYITALENRRQYFKSMGATATDHAVEAPYTVELTCDDAERIFQRGWNGKASGSDCAAFVGHMLMEMARMSIDDGLVMQLHPGSYRNHNRQLFELFGPDMGADIPLATEYTRNLHPLLNKYGNDPRLTLILFTLDESTYSRELAPIAGHYPAVKLGPPWWFHDSLNGMRRYRDLVMETAGLYNTTGFNDDTRAFPSIPARHDLSRRADADWLAGLVVRGIVDKKDAEEMVHDMAYRLARKAYKLGTSQG
jgi:glucuronate isomerase